MAELDKPRPKSFGDKLLDLGDSCSLDTESNSFIGGKYYVLRVDDTWQPAEVIIYFNFHF